VVHALGQEHRRRAVVQFYNRVNLGDDLLVHILASRYRNDISITANGSTALTGLPNVSTITTRRGSARLNRLADKVLNRPRVNHRELATAAQSHDALVHIGGSIFIERNDTQDYWEREAEYYASLPVPYFIIDANFGPYVRPEFPDLVRRILAGAADVCLRDEESFSRFSDLGNVRLAPDAGFTIQPHPSSMQTDVVFSVMDLTATHGESIARSYEAACADAVRDLVRGGRSVLLMSFCEFQRDQIAAERILALADLTGGSTDRAAIYRYTGDLDEALGILSTTGLIVGTRFHATVIGVALGIPTLPIVYSRKTSNMLDEIGFPGVRIDLLSEAWDGTLGDLAGAALGAEARTRLSVEAARQFEGLDAYLDRAGR
jgi:colanic acid/amylovoran biosynthesis protein